MDEHDPFYDKSNDMMSGISACFYPLTLEEILPIIDSCRHMNVQIFPCVENNGTFRPYHDEDMNVEEEQLDDYNMWQKCQLQITVRGLLDQPE